MEDFLLLTILVVLFIRWVILSNRFSELKLRIDNIVEDRQRKVEIDRLVERVHALESEIVGLRRSGTASPKPPAAEPFAAAPIPVVKAPHAPAVPPLPVAPPAIPEPVAPHEEIIVESLSVSPPAFSIPEPVGPTFGQRMREKMGSEEWEAIVGGSWLNKLGVFVLVVGIALFLG